MVTFMKAKKGAKLETEEANMMEARRAQVK